MFERVQAKMAPLIEKHRRGLGEPQVEVFLRRFGHAADEFIKQELKKDKYVIAAMTEDLRIIGEDPLAHLRSEFEKLPGSQAFKKKNKAKRETQESGADDTLELTTQSGADSSAATLPKRDAARQEIETEQSDIEHTRNVLRNELDAKSADSDNENK